MNAKFPEMLVCDGQSAVVLAAVFCKLDLDAFKHTALAGVQNPVRG
jgi:hypothetical protein